MRWPSRWSTFQFVVASLTCVVAATPDDHKEPRKSDRDASYNIDNSTWGWIPLLIITLFTIFMLMSVKSKSWFGGLSLRLYLMRFVSVETLYNTLKNASAHEWQEQYDIELGHQVFSFFGLMLLIVNVVFNPNADRRYAMAVLTYLQIFVLALHIALDCVLMRHMQRMDVVRSVNTKLRFSHCTYQVVLFCTDVIGGSLHLPVDCFIWATIHYAYEAVGLALEGLNVIGMSEFAIIAIVNAKIIGTDVASTGWTCAFGMSSLFVSVVSMIVGQVFKWRIALVLPRKPLREDSHHGQNTARTHTSTHGHIDDDHQVDTQQMTSVHQNTSTNQDPSMPLLSNPRGAATTGVDASPIAQ